MAKKVIILIIGLLSIAMLCSCSDKGDYITISGLRDSGGCYLVDEVYGYSVQFPSEWKYVDSETFNANRNAQIAESQERGEVVNQRQDAFLNTAIINTMLPNEFLTITYANYKGTLDELARQSLESSKISFSNDWSEEKLPSHRLPFTYHVLVPLYSPLFCSGLRLKYHSRFRTISSRISSTS